MCIRDRAYVRITASANMELGELALYDLQGDRIGVRAITGPADADALCDDCLLYTSRCV